MAASFRSDYIWPAAREVVERHDQRAPVPKTPVVRSTHSSRMRSGNAEPEASKGITQVQVHRKLDHIYATCNSRVCVYWPLLAFHSLNRLLLCNILTL